MLVVVNTEGLTQRQLLKEGMHDPAGAIVHGLAGATDIAIAEGRDVYVVSPAQHSVAIFARDAVTGDLSFRGTVTTPGQDVFDTLALSPDGKQLYVAGEDGITIYDRDLAGDLTPSDRTLITPIEFAGVGALSELAPSGDGRFLYAVSPGSNTLLVLDGTSLAVVHRFEGGTYGLHGASDLAVSRDDRFVYVTAESGHTLSVFRRGLDDDVSHFQTLANGVAGVRGMAGPSDVALTPDQSFVLVSGAERRRGRVPAQCGDRKTGVRPGAAQQHRRCCSRQGAAGHRDSRRPVRRLQAMRSWGVAGTACASGDWRCWRSTRPTPSRSSC